MAMAAADQRKFTARALFADGTAEVENDRREMKMKKERFRTN